MASIRSLGLRALIVAGSLSSILAVNAAPTAAYTPYASGYPGGIGTPRIVGTYVDYGTGRVTFPGRMATESARYAAWDQYVCVTSNVVYASSFGSTSWQPYNSFRVCRWIPAAATSVVVPGVNFDVMTHGIFIFSGNLVITWQLSNGALVGKRVLDYNAVGDYACYGCTIASSYSLGAYLLF
jgi:hypothetical protein